MESVERVAEAVLYEGYLLYPYRRSAMKNQQRWTFGGVYPRLYSEANHDDDPWSMQTQCLVLGNEHTTLEVKVRFLQVVDRKVAQQVNGAMCQVEALRVGEQVHRPWEEAVERAVCLEGARDALPVVLGDLIGGSRQVAIDVPGGREDEPLQGPDGTTVGAISREWQALQGTVEVWAEPLDTDLEGASIPLPCFRLTTRITNTTPFARANREPVDRLRQVALRRAFVSTHTILRVQGGEFISLLEPPAAFRPAAERCQNLHTWPVLAGEQGERNTILSSPIILYDYPQIAAESPGNLFDATEIDELLTLSIMTMTDEEKQEMRESDARGREILERTEALTTEQLMKLHGVVRSLQTLREEDT
ncbi:MAG: hypothetical protein JWO42_667 [Chloroflexi bacterium]|jgi:hypothetical protein|nr:hypothetical protein [Chloroflexota bacterium]